MAWTNQSKNSSAFTNGVNSNAKARLWSKSNLPWQDDLPWQDEEIIIEIEYANQSKNTSIFTNKVKS